MYICMYVHVVMTWYACMAVMCIASLHCIFWDLMHWFTDVLISMGGKSWIVKIATTRQFHPYIHISSNQVDDGKRCHVCIMRMQMGRWIRVDVLWDGKCHAMHIFAHYPALLRWHYYWFFFMERAWWWVFFLELFWGLRWRWGGLIDGEMVWSTCCMYGGQWW